MSAEMTLDAYKLDTRDTCGLHLTAAHRTLVHARQGYILPPTVLLRRLDPMLSLILT